MAEVVQYRIEERIQELEQLERIQLFTKEEIQKVLQCIRDHEYRLAGRKKRKEDYIAFINYEINFLSLVKIRRQKIGYMHKKKDIDYAIMRRINRLFKTVIFRHQKDLQLWMAHIDFCKSKDWLEEVSRMYVQMLQVHGDKPYLYITAAKFEWEDIGSADNARQLIMQGLRKHPKEKSLYLEHFRLELLFVEKLKKRQKVLGIPPEQTVEPAATDQVMDSRLPQIVYNSAMEVVGSPEFLMAFFSIAKLFDFTAELQETIQKDLFSRYPGTAVCWDTKARLELQKQHGQAATEGTEGKVHKTSSKTRIKNCFRVYDAAVSDIDTEEMWSLYLDTCVELLETTTKYRELVERTMFAAMQRAAESGNLSEKYYLMLLDHLKTSSDTSTYLSTVSAACSQHPHSVELWTLHLQVCTAASDVWSSLKSVMDCACASKLPPHEKLQLWRTLLEICVASGNIVWFHEYAATRGQDIVEMDKLEMLKIAVTPGNTGLKSSWNFYLDNCNNPPFSLEFHYIMADLQAAQLNVDMEKIRQVMENACSQFGKTSVGVWLRAMKYEKEFGDPTKVSTIYRRAKKNIDAPLVDNLITEYTLNQLGAK